MVRAAAVVVALLSLGLVAPSASSAAGEMTAIPTRQIYPRGAPGRAGDIEIVRWALRDRYGRGIGVGRLNCRWFGRHERLCYGSFEMAHGTFAIIGASETRDFGTFAVVGGTAKYRGVSGELRFTATGIGRLSLVLVV